MRVASGVRMRTALSGVRVLRCLLLFARGHAERGTGGAIECDDLAADRRAIADGAPGPGHPELVPAARVGDLPDPGFAVEAGHRALARLGVAECSCDQQIVFRMIAVHVSGYRSHDGRIEFAHASMLVRFAAS